MKRLEIKRKKKEWNQGISVVLKNRINPTGSLSHTPQETQSHMVLSPDRLKTTGPDTVQNFDPNH